MVIQNNIQNKYSTQVLKLTKLNKTYKVPKINLFTNPPLQTSEKRLSKPHQIRLFSSRHLNFIMRMANANFEYLIKNIGEQTSNIGRKTHVASWDQEFVSVFKIIHRWEKLSLSVSLNQQVNVWLSPLHKISIELQLDVN